MNRVLRPNLDSDPILLSMLQATVASNRVVRIGQRKGFITGLERKPDGTYKSDVDDASELVARPYLSRTGLTLIQEEAGLQGEKTIEVIFHDGLDGTRAQLMGTTSSTVICATYDTLRNVVTRCVVGEPSFCRLWFAGEGEGLWLIHYNPDLDPDDVDGISYLAETAERRYVWDEVVLPGKPTIITDVTPTFKQLQQLEEPITVESLARFMYRLVIEGLDILLPGSNGLHHALIGHGGLGNRAAVTTALGGPWDAAPVFLAYKAGGAVLGFKNGRRIESGLAVTKGDVFISANSIDSANHIETIVLESLYPDLYPLT